MARNFGFVGGVKTIPLYAAFALAELTAPPLAMSFDIQGIERLQLDAD